MPSTTSSSWFSSHDDSSSPWRRFPSMLSRLAAERRSRSARRDYGTHLSRESSTDDDGASSTSTGSSAGTPCGGGVAFRQGYPGSPTVNRSVSCFAMLQSSPSLGRLSGGAGGSTVCLSPVAQLRKDVLSLSQRSSARHGTARRSLNTSTSPVLAPRCKSPHRQLLPTAAVGAGSTAPSTSRGTAPVPLRSYSTRSGSSLMAPGHDNRRWSLASLPSTSGYGTPGSNSAFSSQYSSNEALNEMAAEFRSLNPGGSGGHRFDSADSSAADDPYGAALGGFRPRSRSLTLVSPVKLGGPEWTTDVVTRNSVYKERFPRAKQQMEEKLSVFVAANAPLSGGPSSAETEDASAGAIGARNRKSMVLTAETTLDPSLLRLIADGATRFLHHQLIASDCLGRSRDDTITCSYFCEMSQRLDETLNEAMVKTSGESFEYLNRLVKALLMIVSRPARLLECLEFDPDEFYHLLEEAEGVVREQLGSGTARVPDLPQYIIGKLGLDRDPLLEAEQAAGHSPPSTPAVTVEEPGSVSGSHYESTESRFPAQRAPCEEDLETIRLVSNGAYGAVYLVRHRETRQRFALKKMNKQTLMLRNQIDQVFAERDILTMTDNPFVVSFYGSFETRHHLCMLMEYVEGGDCASLLKNAGTLPVDLARLYVAETVLAIEYLHSYGVVHRDLKPDNLLITAMGHIKLTDFGLSKIGLMNRTTLVAEGFDVPETQQFKDKQLCGTPEYIAPEVILRQGYGKPVDWWALGIISYEFLIGCVPFSGESPEELFGNVISDEVEYPDGEEALPPAAESLIRQLLEKNACERLGSVTGASELMAHEFFVGLDFNTLLRQKAEFVPQLENDEDTSYFDSRTDRYNHDAESCGEEEGGAAPMFHSFSTASPRHSIVGIEPGPLLPPDRIQACTSPLSHEVDSAPSPSPSPSSLGGSGSRRAPSPRKPAPPSAQSSEDHSTTDSMSEMEKYANCPMPSAVLLRRRFSAQRQSNLSTSSSGTTGTGGYVGTAPSSTDSSMDAFAFSERRHTHGEEGRLRTDSTSTVASSVSRRSPLPRFAIHCDPDEEGHTSHGSLPGCSKRGAEMHELSPVDEGQTRSRSVSATSMDRLPGSPLQLVIPSGISSTSGGGSLCHGQLSPGAASGSSASSYEAGGEHPLSPAPITGGPAQLRAPPIVVKKGLRGFGFTIRSVRVYLGEHSDYYTIEHIVSSVDEGGPAFEAGLRTDDMITHLNTQPVHNLTHPQLMNLMLSATGGEIALKVVPLTATGIREGGPRKSVGKLAKKKPKCPKRRLPCEKKPRKPSSLLRRLSGKRAAGDIVPGSSSQKQTFMPRSVSSQDGVILQQPATMIAPSVAVPSVSSFVPVPPTAEKASPREGASKRMSDVGLRDEHRSPLVLASSSLSSSPASAFSAVLSSSTSSSSSSLSARPSTLSGLKPAVSLPRPVGMVLPASGAPPPTVLTTSPIPVSPLARHPSPSRPASPRPETVASAAPVAPAPPPSAPSERPAPPPIPPPPAARNLMARLLSKDRESK